MAEDTDLTLDVAGRTWLNADGRENFPDGEVFTSPHHEHTRGHISFSFDATYHGRQFAGVRLWFEDGRVVRQEASRGEEFLTGMLDMDEGARYLGEVAFGMNDEIQTGHPQHAFDEKIGGTMPRGAGQRLPGGRRHQPLVAALGHRLRPAPRRRGVWRRRADRPRTAASCERSPRAAAGPGDRRVLDRRRSRASW